MTPAELWTIVSVVGAIFASIGVWSGIADMRVLSSGEPALRTLAFGYLRSQTIRLLIQLAWIIAGVVSILGIVSPYITPIFVVTNILVVTNALLAVNAALDLRTRRQLEGVVLMTRDARMDRLESKIREGTEAATAAALEAKHAVLDAAVKVQEGADAAKAAYVAANEVNAKISAQGDRITVHDDRMELTDTHQDVQDGLIAGKEDRAS